VAHRLVAYRACLFPKSPSCDPPSASTSNRTPWLPPHVRPVFSCLCVKCNNNKSVCHSTHVQTTPLYSRANKRTVPENGPFPTGIASFLVGIDISVSSTRKHFSTQGTHKDTCKFDQMRHGIVPPRQKVILGQLMRSRLVVPGCQDLLWSNRCCK
jgi:hypothetical protein